MIVAWLAYLACAVGAFGTYDGDLLYGFWSWSGGALFSVLVGHYLDRHRVRRRRRGWARNDAARAP